MRTTPLRMFPVLRWYTVRRVVALPVSALVVFWIVLTSTPAGGQVSEAKRVRFVELESGTVVCVRPEGNLVASVGPEGAFIVGPVGIASTPEINAWLGARTQSPIRYVVAQPGHGSDEGDGGWGKLGAFVAMQENALRRLGGAAMAVASPLPKRLGDLGVDRPRVSFSEVLAFDINGESIHVVHQPAGHSDSDALTHFHHARLVYLGESYPGDGYPLVDATRGGTLDGLLQTLGSWTKGDIRIVPARGSVRTTANIAAFRNMILMTRDRVQTMARSGLTLDQVIQARPTAEFDNEWGHGQITPAAFVRELFESIK